MNAPPPGAGPGRSRRPYLLRAMHEWMSDSGFTPHVIVDAGRPGAEVPRWVRKAAGTGTAIVAVDAPRRIA